MAEFAQIPPRVLGYPFNSWSLSKLKDAIEERKAVGSKKTISDESIRLILEEHGISYQRTKTWKESKDPEFAAKQQGLLRFSRRIDDCRGAAAEDFADLTAQFFTQLVVKIYQRLIEQQERRFLDQRASQRDALLLPSRKSDGRRCSR